MCFISSIDDIVGKAIEMATAAAAGKEGYL